MARLVHFDVSADDPERAARFYRDALGWEFQKWEGPMDYWLVTTGPDSEPGINGGLAPRDGSFGGGPGGFTCTLDVPDLDAAVARVEAAGGKITVPKMAVPGVGWLVYANDTEGNTFGMMQNDPSAA